MPIYAIGDIQGCFQALEQLLNKINFNRRNDHLWFVGDLVNRGSNSLKTLRFIMDLGDTAHIVLGNHDLYLLARSEALIKNKDNDTIDDILSSPDKTQLLTWLRQQPLIHYDKELDYCMVHAGIHPQWSLTKAIHLATEVSNVLSSDNYLSFLKNMFGNHPNYWDDSLHGSDRLRVITNILTRMRYLSQDYKLNLIAKGAPGDQAKHLSPWFTYPHHRNPQHKIIFGHWSTVHLGNIQDFTIYNVYPIDTGYLWGGRLTALRLEDQKRFSVAAPAPQN